MSTRAIRRPADARQQLDDTRSRDVELGVVYACVEGVNEKSYEECLEQLLQKARALGATAVIALQLVQSQFQWNQRTSLLATAIKENGKSG